MSKQKTFKEERNDIKKRLENIETNRHPFALLLDNVIDEINIGSIFRLADAVRLEKIYLYNKVHYNWNQKKMQRVSRSTFKYVPFQELNTVEQVKKLKSQYKFIGLEITNTSIPYQEFQLPSKKPLIIIGNEKHGISKELLKETSQTVHLPMLGINTSMNVAMASAIFCYHLLQRINAKK